VGGSDSDDASEQASTRHGCVGWSFGQRPLDGRTRGGQRLVLEPLFDAIKSGQSDRDILLDAELGRVAFLHASSYRWAKQVLTAPRNVPEEWAKRDVCVYWGAAGAGKSQAVRAECHVLGRSLWCAPIGASGAWYDGYDGHYAALFDDFRGGMPLSDLLNILEGNQVLVPVKGSFRTWCPKLVFFTSDRPWQQWMFKKGGGSELAPLSPEEEAQLGRRITIQREFRGPPVPLNVALGMRAVGENGRAERDRSPLGDVGEENGDSLPTGGGGGDNTGTPPPFPDNIIGFEQVFSPLLPLFQE